MSVTGLHTTSQRGPIRDFIVWLHATLKKRTDRSPIARSREGVVRAWLDQKWREFIVLHHGPWLIAPGCEVTGINARLAHGSLFLVWRTSAPMRQHQAPLGEGVWLGTFKQYDLAVRYENDHHPILIAIYGTNRREEWRLPNHGYGPQGQHGSALIEANRRALQVNALAGTQWARPDAQGALGTPWLAAAQGAPVKRTSS